MWKFVVGALLGGVIVAQIPLARSLALGLYDSTLGQVNFMMVDDNRAIVRSTKREIEDIQSRYRRFHAWKERRLCRADTEEYRQFLSEDGTNAPVVDCDG